MKAEDTTQLCFDAIAGNVHYLPRDPFAVGGYVNGAITRYIWSAAQWQQFPNSYHLRINVTGAQNVGNTLDVESGDANPGNVKPWIISQKELKDPLIVYCNRSNLAQVKLARDVAAKESGVYAWLWVATLDGTVTDRAMTQAWQMKVPNVGQAVADVSVITSRKLRQLMAARIASV
jgi:hypothetical protein